MIKFPTVLAGLALGALLAPASAQDYIPVSVVNYAKYDMATQTFTVLPGNPDLNPGDADPVVLYDNSATNGYFTTGSGAIKTHHFMDWGTFTTTPGMGADVTEFRMAYVTNILAPTPVTFRMRFYQGATGNGVKGTIIGDYSVTGLPNSASGGFEGWIVDVTLTTPLHIDDGAIGWSYNSDTGGSTTGTGPFLVGPPNGPGAGAAHGPAFGSYDRYLETTDAYVTTLVGSTVMLSMPIRLKGRETGGAPPVWANYGVKSGVTLNGSGSATPGSTDNVITIKNNPAGKSVILVVGVAQSDFFSPSIGLHFYAHPWVLQLAPMATDPLSGDVVLPAPLPLSLTAGDEIYMQAFGQNLANQYKKWSEGLHLTIQ